jgi:hypothetical protein
MLYCSQCTSDLNGSPSVRSLHSSRLILMATSCPWIHCSPTSPVSVRPLSRHLTSSILCLIHHGLSNLRLGHLICRRSHFLQPSSGGDHSMKLPEPGSSFPPLRVSSCPTPTTCSICSKLTNRSENSLFSPMARYGASRTNFTPR